jgi:6-phosphogluconolactonase
MKPCAPGPRFNPIAAPPDIRILPDKAALAQAAAALFADLADTAVAAHGRFLVALSGGSTPQALYTLLAQPSYQASVPWSDIELYWGDERLVPPDNPGSNYFHARELLLDHVPLLPQNIHRIPGELSPTAATAAYKAILQQQAPDGRAWPAFDLVLLGLGADGHTASLFPGSPATAEPVIAVTADYEGRPAARVSLTPAVFNAAHQVLFLVSGADKAPALAAVLNGPQDPQTWPAQRIAPLQPPIWLVDQPAAAQLTSQRRA